jgi:ATP adenylyltransferase
MIVDYLLKLPWYRNIMEFLWSPWRMNYIQSHKKDDSCIFCSAISKPDGLDNLILYRGEKVFIILNRYPYTSGHLMLVPFDHQPTLEALEIETLSELMELAQHSIQVIRNVYQPQGFNLGINIGDVAGAGVTGHVHMHIVPRWSGDTNFMSTLATTRVLPESLEVTYRRLKAALDKLHQGQ